MDITEVRIKLMGRRDDKLQAFCSITINNDFVIRDLKIIEGLRGAFVAMPSRKLTDRCSKCSGKNHLRANYCNTCGERLPGGRINRNSRGRAKLHADIAHPINSSCRRLLQEKVLAAFREELARSKKEGYIPPKYDDDFEEFEEEFEPIEYEEVKEDQEEPVTKKEEENEKEETAEEKKRGKEDEFGAGIFD